MKKWNFSVKNSPEEVSEKLRSVLGRTNRFVFDIKSDKQSPVKFRIRKRVLLAFELLSQNNVIVDGSAFKTDAEKETDLEIAFNLHPVSKLLLLVHLFLGLGFLAGVIFEVSSSSDMAIVGGLLIVTGLLFWLHLQKLFKKHVQEYKILISEILKSERIPA
jgi:hypothetical protein